MRQFFLVDNLEGDDKMEEIWKDIEGYERLYKISNLGRVKSLKLKKKKIMNASCDRYGYKYVNLRNKNKGKKFKVHRLVALAFVDGYFEGAVVNHIDENKQNNLWTNLEWVTNQYNIKYSSYKWSGENSARAVKVRCIETGEIFNTVTQAGLSVGISQSSISEALKTGCKRGGYHWEYV